MKRFSVVPLITLAILLVFNLGCEPDDPDDPYPPPNIDFGEMMDTRDAQKYKTIEIGTQTWIAENLKYLPSVLPSSAESQTAPYYYVYGYAGTSVSEAKATDNFKTYGVLYNLPAALIACPPGWHLPSDAEWTTLTNFLGDNAGGKMKSTILWSSPNAGATNQSGWSGLPGGGRNYFGNYSLGRLGSWWSASKGSAGGAWSRGLYHSSGDVGRSANHLDHGFSVRCLKD